jgi:hypothetical protein
MQLAPYVRVGLGVSGILSPPADDHLLAGEELDTVAALHM